MSWSLRQLKLCLASNIWLVWLWQKFKHSSTSVSVSKNAAESKTGTTFEGSDLNYKEVEQEYMEIFLEAATDQVVEGY
jgi:hypothetical protein